MTTATASPDGDFPDVRNALRATWQSARQQVRVAEASLASARQVLADAQAKASEVQRQIEAACPPLGLDPSWVMAEADLDPVEVRPADRLAGSPTLVEPRAHFDERVADLLADGRLVAGEQLRTIHHGQEHFARLEADGSVSGANIGSKPTLSAAARALVGGARNGWRFWTVLRDGRWIPVADLRNG